MIAVLGAPGSGVRSLLAALQAKQPVLAQQVHPASLMMAAVQADIEHGDSSLYTAACFAHAPARLTLLMGLDLPQHSGPATLPEAAQALHQALRYDAALRLALQRAQLPYRVVYGQGEERLAHALQAMASLGQRLARADTGITGAAPAMPATSTSTSSAAEAERRQRLRNWSCDKCSDPECEHKLFTALRG